MITLNCFTNGFADQSSSVSGKTPRLCQWVYGREEWDGITIFEDGHIWQRDVTEISSRFKIGWLHEARGLRPENYEAAWREREKFDCILTYDEELLKADPEKFRFTIRGGVTVPQSAWGLHYKTRNVAMLISEKTQLEGHQLRHEVLRKVKGIDFYGKAVNRRVDKTILKDYRYVVVVEAVKEKNWFTEHLLDVVALGCAPILYYPPEMIGTFPLDIFLAIEGMALFEDLRQLGDLVRVSNDEVQGKFVYERILPFLYQNLMRLADLEVTEDYFVQRSLSDFVKELA